jgi:hypothetical protein
MPFNHEYVWLLMWMISQKACLHLPFIHIAYDMGGRVGMNDDHSLHLET